MERRQLRVEAGVVPALELAARHDVLRPEARLSGDRRGRRGVVAGHDDRLDPGLRRHAERVADAVADRVGEGEDRPDPPRRAVHPVAAREEQQAASRGRLAGDDPEPGVALRGRRLGQGEDRLRGAQRRFDDDAVAPPRGAGHRRVLGRRIGTDEVRREELAIAAGLVEGRRDRQAERPGFRPAARRPPGVLLGAKRLAEDRQALGAIRRSGGVAGRQHVREHEPVLGQRAGLVGEDQADRAERLLGAQPPDEHAPPEQPVGPNPSTTARGSAAPRGSPRSPRRCPRAGSPGRVAAQEAAADRHDDQPDRDHEQDPDEPVELALERRAPSLLAAERRRDLAGLGPRPGRDDDALAGAADDVRAGERHRAPLDERRARRVRRDRRRLRDRLAGQDAPVDREAGGHRQSQVRRDDVAPG